MSSARVTARRIPFNRPSIEGNELEHMRAAVESGHSSAKGPFSDQVSGLLKEAIGAEEVLMTTSCTAALELSAMMLDLEPGDTVIVPSFTFVTTALAFTRAGARLKFADIEAETLGISPGSVEALLDDSVRAVVPVHYAGVGCEIEGLREVLWDRPDIDVIEDNAHGLFGSIGGRPLGSFGRFSTLSFHETKNFVCGEGGALVINHHADVARAHVLYDKGTNRREFFEGNVDKYSWVDDGSSFGMSDLLAAYLLGQLEAREQVLSKRAALFDEYEQALAPHAEEYGYRTPAIPADRQQAYHMFYVLLPGRRIRDAVLEDLRDQGVHATFHYIPLHDSVGAQPHRASSSDCPVTNDISGRLLRLPFFNELPLQNVQRICEFFLGSLSNHLSARWV